MNMPLLTRALFVAAVAVAAPARAQHEGHAAAASQAAAVSPEQLTACVQSQQQVMALVDAGNRRLELARQTNDAAAMRAAVDDFQTILSAVKMQLASCAQLAAAAPTADSRAGQVMPPAAPAQSAARVAAPASTSPQAAASPDHAAHAQATQPAQKPAAQGTGTLDITFRSTPSPARGAAENQFEVTVKDRQGKPVDGAEVSVTLYMPAMPAMKMPEMRNEVKLKGAGIGRYAGAGQVMMAGQWTATVTVKQNGKEVGQQKVTLTAK